MKKPTTNYGIPYHRKLRKPLKHILKIEQENINLPTQINNQVYSVNISGKALTSDIANMLELQQSI